jgi:peptide/nickel transport system substrate-binding protein
MDAVRCSVRRGRLGKTGLLLTALAILAASCSSGSGSSAAGSGSSGGVLRLGTHAPLESMNPFVSQSTLAYDSFVVIYPYLVQYDLATKEIAPDFATSWSHSPNYRIWTFHTRAGAKWSDGQPLTAADAAWTLNTILKFKNGPTAQDVSNVVDMTGATATSPTTVQVHYSSPVANVLASLSSLPILPEHVWKQYATGNGSKLRTFSNLPSSSAPVVSGGPFTFTKFVQGQIALFQRNPDFYGPAPKIAGFGYQYFADSDAEIEALKSGQIDAALGDPSLPATSISSLKTAGFNIVNVPATSFQDIIINTVPSMAAHRELLNPKVREAIEYATDRATITRVAYLGYAQPGGSIVPPASGKWSDPTVKGLPFSLAKANALLDAAGYTRGSDGIRNADGHPMAYTFLISTDNGGAGIRSGQIMVTDFKKIGIKLTLEVDGDTALNSALYGNHYRSYQLAMWGWDAYLDPNYILSVLTCNQRGNLSDSGYCNPAYDALFTAQASATDEAKRQQDVYQMQRIVAKDRPYLVLVYVNVLEGWSKKWCGIITSPDGFANYFSKDPLEQIHQCGSSSSTSP